MECLCYGCGNGGLGGHGEDNLEVPAGVVHERYRSWVPVSDRLVGDADRMVDRAICWVGRFMRQLHLRCLHQVGGPSPGYFAS